MAKLERYLRKGAELPYTTKSGVNTTVWQKKEIDNAFRAINAQRKALLKKYNPSQYTGTMGAIEEYGIKPRENTVQRIEPKNWDSYVENIQNQAREINFIRKQELYKQNFLKGVQNVFGRGRLYNRLMGINSEKLVELYFTNPIISIGFIYDPKEAEEIEQRINEEIDNLEASGDIVVEEVTNSM